MSCTISLQTDPQIIMRISLSVIAYFLLCCHGLGAGVWCFKLDANIMR